MTDGRTCPFVVNVSKLTCEVSVRQQKIDATDGVNTHYTVCPRPLPSWNVFQTTSIFDSYPRPGPFTRRPVPLRPTTLRPDPPDALVQDQPLDLLWRDHRLGGPDLPVDLAGGQRAGGNERTELRAVVLTECLSAVGAGAGAWRLRDWEGSKAKDSPPTRDVSPSPRQN